ncbi:MAG: tetrahydromethanopterin S-methyltransferase subunit A, partial [Candidatus Aenigmatarchaeota archaeon]
MENWPPLEGRYEVGNPDSPVAVCTMATMELDMPMDRIAIKGKCVTENIGLEKIIKNVVANPKLRFLVMCGRVSNGHFVGQAVKCLVKDGVDEGKNIIGARGGMPVLKNLSAEEIERFRQQIEPVDLIGITDVNKIMEKVEECWEKNPGPFQGEALVVEEEKEEAESLEAELHPPEEWVRDPEGYFLVKPDKESGVIVVEHMSNAERLLRRIRGKAAEDLYHYIIKNGWVTRHDHAAYLGRELAKAEQALQHGMGYEQDENLMPKKPKATAIMVLTSIT